MYVENFDHFWGLDFTDDTNCLIMFSFHLLILFYLLQICVKKGIGLLMVLILLRINNACFAAKELIKTSLAGQNANSARVDIQLHRRVPPLKTIVEVRCLPHTFTVDRNEYLYCVKLLISQISQSRVRI